MMQFQSLFESASSTGLPVITTDSPVRSSRQANTPSPDRNGEDLANHYPSTRTPSGSKEEDVDANERNLDFDGSGVVGSNCAYDLLPFSEWRDVSRPIIATHANNHLTDQHSRSAIDEEGSTTESLDSPEGQRSRTDIDESGDERNQERVRDRAQRGDC